MVLFNNADDNWCSLFSFQHFIWHESVLDFRCFVYVFWHVVYCTKCQFCNRRLYWRDNRNSICASNICPIERYGFKNRITSSYNRKIVCCWSYPSAWYIAKAFKVLSICKLHVFISWLRAISRHSCKLSLT